MSDWPKTMISEYFEDGGREAGHNTEDYEREFDEPIEVIPADLGRELHAALKETLGLRTDDPFPPGGVAALERYEREVGA